MALKFCLSKIPAFLHLRLQFWVLGVWQLYNACYPVQNPVYSVEKYCCVGLGLKVHERVETNEIEVLTKGNALEY
jgi:hypothetical protein